MKLSVNSFLVTSIALALVGCNGESTSSPETTPPPPPPVEVVSAPLLLLAMPLVGQSESVPVYQHVLPRQGKILSLKDVQVDESTSSSSCQTPEINGLELRYTPGSEEVCNYDFTVVDNDNKVQKGRLISSASLTSSDKLPEISHLAVVGTPASYAIGGVGVDDELKVVTVLGSGMAQVDVSGNVINFKAASGGLIRIIYTITSSAGATKMGVINVSVSEAGANIPPFTPDSVVSTAVGVVTTISPKITDVDSGDKPQLIGVVSTGGATVKSAVDGGAVDDAYFANKDFTFETTKSGTYTTYYTAHDHHGGYNTGRVTVNVGDSGLAAKDAVFNRVPTPYGYDFAIDLRSYVMASNPGDVEYLESTFLDSSVDKDTTHLVVPTTASPILTYKYPGGDLTGTVAIKYTVKDLSGIDSGVVYFRFADKAVTQIQTLGSTPDVIEIGNDVTATSTCSNCVQEKTTYKWNYNDTLLSEQAIITVPYGFRGDSLTLVATPYNAKGESGVSKSITYNYPLLTITSFIDKNNAEADDVDTNVVKFNVIKGDGNPLVGHEVTGTVDRSTASLVANSTVTDHNGDAWFNIRSSVSGEVFTTGKVATGRTGITRQVSTLFTEVVDPSPRYCNQFSYVWDLDCLPTVKLASGKIFTANVSKQYVERRYPDAGISRWLKVDGNYGEDGFYGVARHYIASTVCDLFSLKREYGRQNWRLPTAKELNTLYSENGNLFHSRGWPNVVDYWTSEDQLLGGADRAQTVSLVTGYNSTGDKTDTRFFSCVSNP